MDFMRKYLEDLHVIVLDEISMVGADKFHEICRRLQEIFINFENFGGIAMMFVGMYKNKVFLKILKTNE